MPWFEIPMSTSKKNPGESSQMQKAWHIQNEKCQKEGGNGWSSTKPHGLHVSCGYLGCLIQVPAMGVSDNPGVDTAPIFHSAEHLSYWGLIDSIWS